MSEFVQHDIGGAGIVRVVEPGQNYRSTLPGFAEHRVIVFMHDAVFVHDAPRDDEIAGIDDDAEPMTVSLEAKIEDQQAGLKCNFDLAGWQ